MNGVRFIFFTQPYVSSSCRRYQTSTLMGGWEFGIHSTFRHKDLAWKLIMLMLEPNILAPWLVEQGFLPTQVAIGEGESRSYTSTYTRYYG